MYARLFAGAALAAMVPYGAWAGVQVSSSPWGHTNEGTVEIYKLTNAHGIEARFITYGATLVSLTEPLETIHRPPGDMLVLRAPRPALAPIFFGLRQLPSSPRIINSVARADKRI